MKFLALFLRRLVTLPIPPPTAPSAPEPLPDNWLTDVHFDLSRLTVEQLDQKVAYHEGEANRLEEEIAKEEVESVQRLAVLQDNLNGLEGELVSLQLDQQRLRGALQHNYWVMKLCRLFGEEIGTKLANHEIEPGMTREHLIFTYGVPDEGNIAVLENRMIFGYGSEKRGAYFELVDNIITQVAIITPPPYPPHAFEDYDEEAELEDEAA